MTLPKANYWLKRLLSELRRRGYASAVRGIKLQASKEVDARNKKSARAFCHVTIGGTTIHCARAIELLSDHFITGILLHEIMHVVLEHEPGDPETNVDEFVIEHFPDAGYTYADSVYWVGRQRRFATSIECVKTSFLEKIL